MNIFSKLFLACLVLGGLSACVAPRGAALQSEIVKESQQEMASFQLVAMADTTTLEQVAGWPATGAGLGLNWPGKGQSQPSRILRGGDIVDLTIWDSQPNSLLATPEQRSVNMHGLEISPDGTIFVPYIEEVEVAGLSPEAARAEIQKRLTPIAPSAQVQLAVREGDQNTIELVGGVARPGRYPLASRGVTILSMLAEAGGIPDAMRNAVVRLQRGGTTYTTLASAIYRDPGRDILLRGGDRVVVESDPRRFTVLGATGAERSIPFEKADHTLLEALSMGGGLAEGRADLRAVMVLRKYPAKALREGMAGPNKENVVFAFDLSSGAGLFNARSFKVHPDDVILATESPLPATHSILGLFGATLGTVQRAESL